MGRNGTCPAGKTRSADIYGCTSKMGKLKAKGLNALLTKPPKRHADGDGLFFKTLGKGRAYWTYRFTLKGRETEMSLGAYPEISLDEARVIAPAALRRCRRRQRPGGRAAQEWQGPGPDAERRSHLRPLRRSVHRPARRRLEELEASRSVGGDAEDLRRANPLRCRSIGSRPPMSWRFSRRSGTTSPRPLTPPGPHRGGARPRRRSMAGFRRTGRTLRGGRTGSTANCPRQRSSARAAITGPPLQSIARPHGQLARTPGSRRWRCGSPS